jgi:soluble lytic murein transglycosylase-like protein
MRLLKRFLFSLFLWVNLPTQYAIATTKGRVTEQEIAAYARSQHFFDPKLVVAIARVESGYRYRVTSLYKGITYYGLMQMSYGTAHMMGFRGKPHELLNWRTNLRWSIRYLEALREEHVTTCRTVAAYNAGTVYMRGKYFVNEGYVRKVMAAHRSINSIELATDVNTSKARPQ